MLKLLAVFAACLGLSHAGINYLDCNTYTYQYGNPGDALECPDGYLLTEFCSSGATAACDRFHSYIRCCRHDGYTDDTPAAATAAAAAAPLCYEAHATLGTKHDCFSGDYVAGMCVSGDGPSLCSGSPNVMRCCEESSVRIGSQCRWVYGDYGQTISCGVQVQEAIIGSCASGSSPWCDGRSHAILCCNLL